MVSKVHQKSLVPLLLYYAALGITFERGTASEETVQEDDRFRVGSPSLALNKLPIEWDSLELRRCYHGFECLCLDNI